MWKQQYVGVNLKKKLLGFNVGIHIILLLTPSKALLRKKKSQTNALSIPLNILHHVIFILAVPAVNVEQYKYIFRSLFTMHTYLYINTRTNVDMTVGWKTKIFLSSIFFFLSFTSQRISHSRPRQRSRQYLYIFTHLVRENEKICERKKGTRMRGKKIDKTFLFLSVFLFAELILNANLVCCFCCCCYFLPESFRMRDRYIYGKWWWYEHQDTSKREIYIHL